MLIQSVQLVGCPIPTVKASFRHLDYRQIGHRHGCQNGIKLGGRRNKSKVFPQGGKRQDSADRHYGEGRRHQDWMGAAFQWIATGADDENHQHLSG